MHFPTIADGSNSSLEEANMHITFEQPAILRSRARQRLEREYLRIGEQAPGQKSELADIRADVYNRAQGKSSELISMLNRRADALP